MLINLTPTTYARMSLATNPLAEVAMSVRELFRARGSPGLRLWRRQALPAVQGMDLEHVRVLFTECDLAEILSPPPAESTPDFHRQLDELVAVPEDWLVRDLRRMYCGSVPPRPGTTFVRPDPHWTVWRTHWTSTGRPRSVRGGHG